MKTKLMTMLVALGMTLPLAAVFNGASANPLPPYGPVTDYPPLPDDDDYPSRAVSGDPCPPNNNVGYSGAPGTYHVYTGSGFLANALDSCMQTPASGEIVACFEMAVGEVVDSVEALDPDVDPLVDAVFDCNAEGILNTGTDGEFEWGFASAWLQVRTGPTSTGNGGGTHGCINGAFDDHHGTDTVIHVLDAVNGANVGFTVTADWSRGATSGDGDCGDGTVEPCGFSGPPPATPPVDPGDLPGTIGGTLDWIFHNLEAATGCNTLDYSSTAPPGVNGCEEGGNCWSATAHGFANLAEVGSTAGYEGSAGGTLVVFINVDLGPPPSAGVAGWVWTDTVLCPCGTDTIEFIGEKTDPNDPTTFTASATIRFTVGDFRVLTSENVVQVSGPTAPVAPQHTPSGNGPGSQHNWQIYGDGDFLTRTYEYWFNTTCLLDGSTSTTHGFVNIYN